MYNKKYELTRLFVYYFQERKTEAWDIHCSFPHNLRGTWWYADLQQKEEVRINKTAVHFASFGTFICTERSFYSDGLYKTATAFSNGWYVYNLTHI